MLVLLIDHVRSVEDAREPVRTWSLQCDLEGIFKTADLLDVGAQTVQVHAIRLWIRDVYYFPIRQVKQQDEIYGTSRSSRTIW